MAIQRVHHLNCGTMCPNAGLLGTGGLRDRGEMVCHCLLLETDGAGLVLVDSGFGTADVSSRKPHPLFRRIAAPALDPDETALAQVRALGFAPEDVRHIVVTHLDVDHAGGLPDFPWARVHVHALERDAALLRRTFPERQRYMPHHVAHGPRWQTYREAGDTWFGFEAVGALEGIGEDVALIPLFGHSRGHAGIAVRTADGWILHGGDAFFHHTELEDAKACPRGLRVFQSVVQFDRKARLANAQRLRELHAAHAADVRIICAHDPSFL